MQSADAADKGGSALPSVLEVSVYDSAPTDYDTPNQSPYCVLVITGIY